MTITARGVAIVCGVLLGGFGALGLLIPRDSPSEANYLLASWLLPITLFPAAALAAALDGEAPRTVGGQTTVLWPTYVGLALYAAVAGERWLDVSSRGTHENFAAVFLLVVLAVHACVLLAGGMALVPFQRTRPAAFQMWIGYGVLFVCWIVGMFAL
jgi:hypothetical protein